ncbi:MAG: hypothetical protein R3F43_00445 [bacterium]
MVQKPALVGFLEAQDITPIAYSSLVPLSTWRAAPGQERARRPLRCAPRASAPTSPSALAEKHASPEAQVLLRWAVQSATPSCPRA